MSKLRLQGTAPVLLPSVLAPSKHLSEDKLKSHLERVLVDQAGQILIPLSDKNITMQVLITLEQMFTTNQKLQVSFKDINGSSTHPVVYLEHMSRETLGVGRSHLDWMNFQDNKVF